MYPTYLKRKIREDSIRMSLLKPLQGLLEIVLGNYGIRCGFITNYGNILSLNGKRTDFSPKLFMHMKVIKPALSSNTKWQNSFHEERADFS